MVLFLGQRQWIKMKTWFCDREKFENVLWADSYPGAECRVLYDYFLGRTTISEHEGFHHFVPLGVVEF